MRLLLTVAFLSSFFMLNAQEQLTLENAISITLENNYGIKIARNELEVAENNTTLGNAGFLPQINTSFNRSYGIQDIEQVRNSGESEEISGANTNNLGYGIQLDWTIFDGLRMFVARDQLEELNLQGMDNLQTRTELTIFQLRSNYFQTAAEEERLKLLESNITLSEERLNNAKDKYELGKASKLEYLQAQVDLNSDKSALLQQSELLAQGKFNLLEIMGVDSDSANFNLKYQLSFQTDITLTSLLIVVENENPELSALKRQQLINHQNEKIVQSEMLPQIGVFGSFNHSRSESPGNFFVERTTDNVTYGLGASWRVFDGFNLQRRKQNAKIESESAQLRYEQRLLEIKTDIKNLFINYQNNLNLLQLETENLEVAKENNEIAKDRYEIGLSNSVELREAQINLINAELRAQNAAFAAKQAELELLFLAGRSVPD